jgi:hypothetical protein
MLHGWRGRQVKPGTWAYRDQRFIYRTFESAQLSTGCTWCDDKVAEWLFDADVDLTACAISRRRS